MELVESLRLLAGIESGQVGYPLAHCRAGFTHCFRSDRVTGGSFSFSVHGCEHEDVANLRFRVKDSSEGAVRAVLCTEMFPLGEIGGRGSSGLNCCGFAAFVERRAEMRYCACSGFRCNRRQGLLCG